MSKNSKQIRSGLDDRYRDRDGEIRRKHGDTLVGTLRKTYGADFARSHPSDMKLSTLLKKEKASSLTELVRRTRSENFTISDSSGEALFGTATIYQEALKRLAKR